MQVVIIFLLFFVVMVAVFSITLSVLKKERARADELENRLKKNNQNAEALKKHTQELSSIFDRKNKIHQDLQKADTNEEITEIINNIVDVNNNRLQNNSRK